MARSKLDAQWFSTFQKAYVVSYEWLQLDAKAQERIREAFLQTPHEDRENPYFYDAYTFTEENLVPYLNALRSLQREVEAFNPDTDSHLKALREVYREVISHFEAQIDILRATARGDDSAFVQASREAYGAPQPAIAKFTFQNVDLSSLREASGPHHKEALSELEDIYARMQTYLADISAPSYVTSEHLPPEIPEFDSEDIMTASEVREYFVRYTERLHIPEWDVNVDETGQKRSINVSQQDGIIWIPHEEVIRQWRIPMHPQNVRAKAVHEAGVHAYRRSQAERSPLRIWELGLPGAEGTEEGVALWWEQTLQGLTSFYGGWLKYLALAFASGVLTGELHDFKTTFRLISNLSLVDNPDLSREEADDIAWNTTWRIFRGSTGRTPGAVFTKDVVYREGNIAAWHAPFSLEEDWIYRGKFDIFNEEQKRLLGELGVI